jgi:hypothetical protein
MIVDFRTWRVLLLFAALSALPVFVFAVGPEETGVIAFGELSPVELATALAYLTGAGLAVYAAFHSWQLRRWFFIAWVLVCLLLFGEETSWLQSYIQYSTPDVVAGNNAQGEFNLHNLNFAQGSHEDRLKNVDSFGALISSLCRPDRVIQYFFLAVFALYPLLNRVRKLPGFVTSQQLPCPGPRLLLSIWLPVVVTTALIFASSGDLVHALEEMREMFYAMAMAAFIFVSSRSLDNSVERVIPASRKPHHRFAREVPQSAERHAQVHTRHSTLGR